MLPESDFQFPEDQLTDRSERFLTAEVIREKITRNLSQELPYAVVVEIESFKEKPNLIEIHAIIWVEKESQKKIIIGGLAFGAYQWLLAQGYEVEAARNGTLLLMVLFENVQAFNSRSESRSVFRHNPLRNKLLFFGTLAAQLVHIGAMYTPGLSDVLGVQPVSFEHWAELLALALVLLAAMELYKWLRPWRGPAVAPAR